MEARDKLLLAVYPALRAMAQQQLGSDAAHFTLRPTELAHEAFLRLQSQRLGWDNREPFHAIVATVLRRGVRRHLCPRRTPQPGGRETDTPVIDDSVDWLQVEGALISLEGENPDLARVVELKFYSGLKTEEIALVMNSSVATVGRQWRFAKAWLGQHLAG